MPTIKELTSSLDATQKSYIIKKIFRAIGSFFYYIGSKIGSFFSFIIRMIKNDCPGIKWE